MTEREFDMQQPVPQDEPLPEAAPASEQSTLSLDQQPTVSEPLPAEQQETAPRKGKNAKKDKSAKKNSVLRTTLLYIFLFLFVTGFFAGATALGAVLEICYGPSETARNTFVSTAKETTRFKWVPHVFFSDEQVEAILNANTLLETDETTDPNLQLKPTDPDIPLDTIEVHDVVGLTYTGKMMVVYDPSRVTVGTLPSFSSTARGWDIEKFVQKTGAVAAINGGGFVDTGGKGKGGMPVGIVIKDNKLIFGNANSKVSIVGFDNENRLIVGSMTAAQALERGVRDAVNFGPALIVNGEPVEVVGNGGGLNPRTIIGQRADGAVLLLVIEGRQAHSLGASYADCIEQMLAFGAINATNLDGGSSSMMWYGDRYITGGASMYGDRTLPTVFLVMPFVGQEGE